MGRNRVVNSQRVFFALWPDAAARTKLAELARATAGKNGGRPTPPDLIHLTLAFLGSQSAARVLMLRQIAGGIRSPSFVLALDQLGTFPRAGIAWLGASVRQPGLDALHGRLATALRAQSFAIDARPYAPHLTLTRRGGNEIDSRLPQPVSWRVTSFALVESEFGGDGTAYRTLAQWPLAMA